FLIVWANLSNTLFRLHKHWIHEGGISTLSIMHWPDKIKKAGDIRHTPGQLPDTMATVLEETQSNYPVSYKGNNIIPLEEPSLTPTFLSDVNKEQLLSWKHMRGMLRLDLGNGS